MEERGSKGNLTLEIVTAQTPETRHLKPDT